jgi:hypothetical protein
MKITVYNSVIDKIINDIKFRFSRDTLNLIDSVGNLLKLEIEKNIYKLFLIYLVYLLINSTLKSDCLHK